MSRFDLTDMDTISVLADALQAAGVDGLEITDSGGQLRIVVDTGRHVSITRTGTSMAAVGTAHVVKAPMAGHFLMRATTQELGVEKGDVLGFMQIGPVLLPLRADRSASSIRWIADERQLVGYGEPLFELSA